jgi:FkbM family methyltransferase
MFGLKPMARRLASALLEVETIPRHEISSWPENRYIRSLLRFLNVDCVFDVGANRGQFGQWLRALGFGGKILSFEPNPAPFAALERAAAADHDWTCFPWALGETNGHLTLNVMALDVFSSFLKPTGDSSLGFVDENTIVSSVEVPVRRLDSVYAELARDVGFTRPFLKMDTQGFDLRVIEGSGETMQRFCGLLSEVAVRNLYEHAPDLNESLSTFRRCGFELAGLFSVHPDRILELVEMNAYCVRRDLINPEAIQPNG